MFTGLNFLHAGQSRGFGFYALWLVITVLNTLTIAALVGGAVAGFALAWGWFGWN